MTRTKAKTDANQPDVVKDLRKAGISVYATHALGKGFPDLVCGGQRRVTCPHCEAAFLMRATELLEVKDGAKVPSAQKLTPLQVEFIAKWRGSPVHVVTSVAEALAVFMEGKE